MAEYKYRSGAGYKVSAETAAEALLAMREKYGGLDAKMVVEDSQDEGAPLHPVFEWDDSKAADEYRTHQARNLIRSVVVVQEGGETRQIFVNVRPTYYERADIVASDPMMFESAMRLLSSKLASARDAVAKLSELGEEHLTTQRQKKLVSRIARSLDTAVVAAEELRV